MQEKSRQTCEYENEENSISKEERQNNVASGPEELGLIDLEKTNGSIENSNSLKVTIDDIDCTQLDQTNREIQKVDSRL